jgi:type VI secretion system secreted protein VgrG
MPNDYILTALPPKDIYDLSIASIEGSEELGRSFEYRLVLTSSKHTLKADDFLGQPMAVQIKPGEGQERYVHGIVSVFRYLGSTASHATYEMTLRPWSWLLSKRRILV